jgi:hypothetical protein
VGGAGRRGDPEIPAASLVELGVIGAWYAPAARPEGGERLTVDLLPTRGLSRHRHIMRLQIGGAPRAP